MRTGITKNEEVGRNKSFFKEKERKQAAKGRRSSTRNKQVLLPISFGCRISGIQMQNVCNLLTTSVPTDPAINLCEIENTIDSCQLGEDENDGQKLNILAQTDELNPLKG